MLEKVEDAEGDGGVGIPAMEKVDALCLAAETWLTR